ncbi:MAG TPA: hypothetical protein VIV15_10685 [Anaerolineales bacterium]
MCPVQSVTYVLRPLNVHVASWLTALAQGSSVLFHINRAAAIAVDDEPSIGELLHGWAGFPRFLKSVWQRPESSFVITGGWARNRLPVEANDPVVEGVGEHYVLVLILVH